MASKSFSESVGPSANGTVCQTVVHSVNLSVYQWVSQPVWQSVNFSVSESLNQCVQPISQSARQYMSDSHSLIHLVSPSDSMHHKVIKSSSMLFL